MYAKGHHSTEIIQIISFHNMHGLVQIFFGRYMDIESNEWMSEEWMNE